MFLTCINKNIIAKSFHVSLHIGSYQIDLLRNFFRVLTFLHDLLFKTNMLKDVL